MMAPKPVAAKEGAMKQKGIVSDLCFLGCKYSNALLGTDQLPVSISQSTKILKMSLNELGSSQSVC